MRRTSQLVSAGPAVIIVQPWSCDSDDAVAAFERGATLKGMKHHVSIERLLRWLTWACVGVLAVLSLTPGDDMVRTGAPGQFEHFVAYLGTTAVACFGYGRRIGVIQVAALLIGYAGLLEIGQIWVPARHSDVIDFAAGSAGVAAGVIVRRWIWR